MTCEKKKKHTNTIRLLVFGRTHIYITVIFSEEYSAAVHIMWEDTSYNATNETYITGINDILLYIQIEYSYFKL